MRALRFFEMTVCLIAMLWASAVADSLQLRNGRHLQGKYIGGTATAIGFMTDRTVEYFPISNVQALIFDNNPEAPLSMQPNSWNGDSTSKSRQVLRRTDASTERMAPKLKQVSAASTSVAN